MNCPYCSHPMEQGNLLGGRSKIRWMSQTDAIRAGMWKERCSNCHHCLLNCEKILETNIAKLSVALGAPAAFRRAHVPLVYRCSSCQALVMDVDDKALSEDFQERQKKEAEKSSKECPYCNTAMAKGILVGGMRPLQWAPASSKPFLGLTARGAVDIESGGHANRSFIPIHYCPNCNKLNFCDFHSL